MTVRIDVEEAKTRLFELLAAVDAGEDVIIFRGGAPAARPVRLISPSCASGCWKVLWIPSRSLTSSSR